MKILILSCNTGGGHNAAARAIQESALQKGLEAEVVDYLNFFNNTINHLTCDTYVKVVQYIPGAFGALYRFGELLDHVTPQKARSIMYYGASYAAKKLNEYLKQNPVDAIVCTHMLAAEAVAWLKNHDYQPPVSVMVATDYASYPFLREASCDYFVAPHEEIVKEWVKEGVPEERILPYGIPVSNRFSNLPGRETAREKLGVPESATVYLVMGGSMGAGKLRSFTRKLLPEIGNGIMMVICGKNDRLRSQLEKQFEGCENVRIIGYTDEVNVYMAACDCLYTKPGGLTSTETLVSGAPVVCTKPIPGCESDNFRFFTEKGLCVPAKHLKDQVKLGIALAESPEQRERMHANQSECAKPDAANAILDFILRKLSGVDASETEETSDAEKPSQPEAIH